MNNYEKYELQKHSSMKNQSYLFDKLNFDSDIIISRLKNKNSPPMNSFSNETHIGINLQDICNRVANSSILSNGENNIYIKLSEDELMKRQYVIECIKKFINLYKIKYKMLYNIIFLFDTLIYIDNKVKVIQNYEQLGLGSTILMIKFNHEEKRNISVGKYQAFYERIHYPKIIIKEIEILCLKLIDYYINFPTPLLYIELYSFISFISKKENISPDMHYKLYNMAFNTLEKIMTTSNEYTKYNMIEFTSSIIAYCRQYYNLEKWPKNLAKIFGSNLKNFESIICQFLPLDDNMNVRTFSIKSKLFYKKSNEKIFILKKYSDSIENENKNRNIYNNHINKDIKVNKNNNIEINTFKINNNDLNINLNYRSSEEMKKSCLFRKINNKYNNNTLIRELNVSSSLNNINQINALNVLSINEKIIKKENITNTYKTPDKIINNKNTSSICEPNKQQGFKYYKNKSHHRNISNIDITIKNYDNILVNDKEEENELNNKDNNENVNKRLITINKNEERKIYKKFYNKINKEINTNSNENENEEIKVRIKEFDGHNEKHKVNNFIATKTELILGNKYDIYNNTKTMNNNTYKKNIIQKSIKSTMMNNYTNNFKPDNILRKSSEDSFVKNISINRLSSCNNKFKTKNIYIHHKEDDYSNETTSENSHNLSIRRNYFRLKRLKDSSINIKNENITTVSNNKENNYIIKCNLKNRESENFHKITKYSKIKDCLKIGSIDGRFQNKISDIHNDFHSANSTKRNEIRSYYKLKKINNHF